MILNDLKETTKTQHEQAEQAMNLPERLRSVQNYTHLLSRFLAFYGPLEDRVSHIEHLDSLGIDFQQRRKSHRLRDDLRTCGWSEAEITATAPCGQLPAITNLPAALGCLYVMEGATLGGQYIRREVESRLGFTADRGCSFFAGYGAETRPMWQSFCTALTDYSQQEPVYDPQIVAAAQDTFTCFENWVANR